jgi:hypothetical protein
MKDEKKRGMHAPRGNTHAASGVALAVNQARRGSQPNGFFILPPSSFILLT